MFDYGCLGDIQVPTKPGVLDSFFRMIPCFLCYAVYLRFLVVRAGQARWGIDMKKVNFATLLMIIFLSVLAIVILWFVSYLFRHELKIVSLGKGISIQRLADRPTNGPLGLGAAYGERGKS